MRLSFIVLVVSIAIAIGCQQPDTGGLSEDQSVEHRVATPTPSTQLNLTQEQAIAIAKGFLDQQPWKNEYAVAKEVRVMEYPGYWYVFFKRLKPAKPNEGLVLVHKKTRKAEWVYLE